VGGLFAAFAGGSGEQPASASPSVSTIRPTTEPLSFNAKLTLSATDWYRITSKWCIGVGLHRGGPHDAALPIVETASSGLSVPADHVGNDFGRAGCVVDVDPAVRPQLDNNQVRNSW